MTSKNSTGKNNFYLPILNALEHSTNLSNIQRDLSISKQNLTYYLRNLKRLGLIIQKGRGWYEVVKDSKNQLMYGNLLKPDFTRGHAYIWSVKIPKETKGWDKRIEILKSKGVHFNLVGIKQNIPRIKVLGRKVWLCNNHLRIFDKKGNSYYGKNATEVRRYALNEIGGLVVAINTKLGLSISSLDIEFNREHYALIKNDLAIEHNRKGETLHISDRFGEWLLIDDSLEEGGELENIGKSAYRTNIPMQKWWNNQKETGFKVTPQFILDGFNVLTNNQQAQTKDIKDFAIALNKHIPAYEGMEKRVAELVEAIKELKEQIRK